MGFCIVELLKKYGNILLIDWLQFKYYNKKL